MKIGNNETWKGFGEGTMQMNRDMLQAIAEESVRYISTQLSVEGIRGMYNEYPDLQARGFGRRTMAVLVDPLLRNDFIRDRSDVDIFVRSRLDPLVYEINKWVIVNKITHLASLCNRFAKGVMWTIAELDGVIMTVGSVGSLDEPLPTIEWRIELVHDTLEERRILEIARNPIFMLGAEIRNGALTITNPEPLPSLEWKVSTPDPYEFTPGNPRYGGRVVSVVGTITAASPKAIHLVNADFDRWLPISQIVARGINGEGLAVVAIPRWLKDKIDMEERAARKRIERPLIPGTAIYNKIYGTYDNQVSSPLPRETVNMWEDLINNLGIYPPLELGYDRQPYIEPEPEPQSPRRRPRQASKKSETAVDIFPGRVKRKFDL